MFKYVFSGYFKNTDFVPFGVDNCFSQLCLTYLINNVYRGIDKYPLLWYNKV